MKKHLFCSDGAQWLCLGWTEFSCGLEWHVGNPWLPGLVCPQMLHCQRSETAAASPSYHLRLWTITILEERQYSCLKKDVAFFHLPSRNRAPRLTNTHVICLSSLSQALDLGHSQRSPYTGTAALVVATWITYSIKLGTNMISRVKMPHDKSWAFQLFFIMTKAFISWGFMQCLVGRSSCPPPK